MKTFSALLACAFVCADFARAEWTPSEKPDPRAILKESEDDAVAGRFADALAKQIWFQKNAVQYDPTTKVLRVTFALDAWKHLADAYPPAREKLEELRDEDGEKVLEGKSGAEEFQIFQEFAAINQRLGEDYKTAQIFVWLDGHRAESAKRDFPIAEAALIKSKEYQAVGKYLDAGREIGELQRNFEQQLKLAEQPEYGDRMRELARLDYSKRAATLVALLVINGRKDEAVAIAEKAKEASSSPEFEALLKAALDGKAP